MNELTNFEFKRFLLLQASCLAVVAIFLLARDIVAPTTNTFQFSWLFYLVTLSVIVFGVFVQRFVRENIRSYLLKVAGLYGFITLAILPMLFVR